MAAASIFLYRAFTETVIVGNANDVESADISEAYRLGHDCKAFAAMYQQTMNAVEAERLREKLRRLTEM